MYLEPLSYQEQIPVVLSEAQPSQFSGGSPARYTTIYGLMRTDFLKQKVVRGRG